MEDIAGVHVTKHVELPQTRSFDKIVDVPVGMRRQMPAILTLQKTMEVLQSLYLDPRNGRARCEQRQAPMTDHGLEVVTRTSSTS